ncbi:TPA: hypothetical protein ACWCZZ_000808 [Legionella pneumophila]
MGKVKQHLMKEAVLVLMQEFFIKLKRILQLILRLINVSLAILNGVERYYGGGITIQFN